MPRNTFAASDILQDERTDQESTASQTRSCSLLSIDKTANRGLQVNSGTPVSPELDSQRRRVRMRLQREVCHFSKHEIMPRLTSRRRKDCCHPFVSADLFKFMTTLIKVSNHIALICPGTMIHYIAVNRHMSYFIVRR